MQHSQHVAVATAELEHLHFRLEELCKKRFEDFVVHIPFIMLIFFHLVAALPVGLAGVVGHVFWEIQLDQELFPGFYLAEGVGFRGLQHNS